MKNKLTVKNKVFYYLVSIICIIVTMFMVITGAYIKETYDIKIGSVSSERFIAPNDIINEYATNKLIEEAKASVSPLYAHDEKVQEKVLGELNDFFDKTKAILSTAENSQGTDGYIFQSNNDKNNSGTVSSKVYLTNEQLSLLKKLDSNSFNTFRQNVISITNEALEQGIREDSDKSTAFIKEQLTALNLDNQLTDLAYHIISSVIEPNLIVDTEATNKAKEEKAAEVEPIKVLKNQKIVDKGDIITEEAYSLLNALGYVSDNPLSSSIYVVIGTALFIIISFSAIFFYINTYHKDIVLNKKQVILLLSLYFVVLLISRFMQGLNYLVVPLMLFPFLTALLINSSLAIFLNFFTVIICCFVFKGDLNFILYYCLGGAVFALSTNISPDRNKLYIAGIVSAVINCGIAFAITLLFDKNWTDNIIKNLIYSFSGSILSLILAIGSLPIWEALFGIVSSFKLLELINPNKELLRRLLIEAPGTYHHSLIVANLAEAAAYDIGANPTLARVGAYYHDIGKLKSPQYFSENIVGENLHDYMDPYKSAKIILSHVEEGLALADKYKLPQAVKDTIKQHHGNTLIKFFYFKAVKKYGEGEVKQKDFRYKEKPPQSREVAVIMLADTCEAAVRSMIPSGKTMTEIESFVKTLIKDKLDDGQLKDSQLTIADLDTIVQSFMGIFKGMYHERIPYPEDKKEEKKEDTDKADKEEKDKPENTESLEEKEDNNSEALKADKNKKNKK